METRARDNFDYQRKLKSVAVEIAREIEHFYERYDVSTQKPRVLTVNRHCLPLTRLPRVAGGAPGVNHKATAIWLALRILAGNEHCNVCDGNMVSEYIFNFLMVTYEWMHPKYVWRICNYLFCIHAKCYKHISHSYYKPDAQSLKFCWRCSYWIFSKFSIQGFHNL